ncbi:hypothetical protein ABCR94_34850 [Streptomyces sp. 21So2-11]|uniref:hypothetical protein n=1 Tax=Streptomyces sp. 21So2-11 TaxID=3144408 RepID=UPI003219E06E
MHGSGAAPPARNEGVVIGLRVLFTLCGALSCGLLSCVPLFRIALLRGKGFDWVLAWGSLPVSLIAFGVAGSLPVKDPRTDVAVVLVLLLGMASAVYFLVFDIRHHQRPQALGAPGPYGPYSNTVPQYGAYPNQVSNHLPNQVPNQTHNPGPPLNPYVNTPVPGQPSYGYPATPTPTPTPHPHSPRLDQVRAELDELSDYLRKDSGSGNGNGGNSDPGSSSSRDGDGR